MIEFITVLAWVFGVISSIITLARIIGFFNYSGIQKTIDELEGIERTFPIYKCGTLAIVCWAWIITQL